MNVREALERSRFFQALPAAELDLLAKASRPFKAEKRATIIRAGAPQNAVLLLVRGTIALYRRGVHRRASLLLGLVQGSAIIGDAECAAGVPWIVSIRAESSVAGLFLPNEVFLSTARRHAEVAFQLYQSASVRHLMANYTAQALALGDAELRLVRLLLDYGQCFGRPDGGGLVIEGHAKTAVLAAGLGINRKTVERAMAQLEEGGIITKMPGQGSLRITSVDALKARLPRDALGLWDGS